MDSGLTGHLTQADWKADLGSAVSVWGWVSLFPLGGSQAQGDGSLGVLGTGGCGVLWRRALEGLILFSSFRACEF